MPVRGSVDVENELVAFFGGTAPRDRVVEQCAQFDEEFGNAEGLIKLAGNAMLPGYTAPKILWLKQNEPRNYKSLATVLLCRWRGAWPTWCVGVRRLPPFGAHAWVEAEGVAVGEDYPPDYFRTLFTVP